MGTVLRASALPLVPGTAAAAAWVGFAEQRASLWQAPATLESLLAGSAAWLLAVVLGWLALLGLLVLAESGSGRRWSSRAGCPEALRRWLLSAAGLTALTVLAAPAHATDSVPSPRQLVAGLSLPDRTPGAVTHPRSGVERTILVRAGDSLWSIAAERLPDEAEAGRVAAAVQRIIARNRAQLPDPDLIHPGQRLVQPASLSHRTDPSKG